ncbi:unnamed protein product [Paramecium sonneborni]|uniref:Uncharacterized protein n=1 Tax=Paramecium sonneborni TaxID=65129 RepID=A0A8S1RSX8_9CILI|nr:unnamed protein product [Paramecium sonneborni]
MQPFFILKKQEVMREIELEFKDFLISKCKIHSTIQKDVYKLLKNQRSAQKYSQIKKYQKLFICVDFMSKYFYLYVLIMNFMQI